MKRHLPLVALCLLALAMGLRTTGDLTWPADPDLLRDVAQARNIADGNLLGDPFYAGETLWYNPLVPGLVALLAHVTGAEVHTVAVRAGAYLNLLAPLAFYALLVRWLGRAPALAATFAILFLREPLMHPWAMPTYTPWLFAGNFSPVLFYLSLGAYDRACERGGGARALAAGALAGLALLGHTAAGLLAGGVLAVDALAQVWVTRGRRAAWARLLWVATGALVVSAPFLGPIALRYGFRTANPVPAAWVGPAFLLENAGGFLRLPAVWAAPFALLSLAWLVRRGVDRRRLRLLLAWALGALLLCLYGYVSQWAESRGIALPRPVPPHHFHLYLVAAEIALIAFGLAQIHPALRVVLAHRAGSRVARISRSRIARALAWGVGGLFLIGSAWACSPTWRYSEVLRRRALDASRAAGPERLVGWIRESSRPEDVLLTSEAVALQLVGPAGRKCLVVPAVYSNPYVAWQPRRNALDSMRAALAAHDMQTFNAEADRWRVRFVLLERHEAESLVPGDAWVPLVARAGVVVYGRVDRR